MNNNSSSNIDWVKMEGFIFFCNSNEILFFEDYYISNIIFVKNVLCIYLKKFQII